MPYGCGDALVGLVQQQLITCPKTQEHTGPATPVGDVGQERPAQGQQLKLLAPCRVEGFFIVVFSYRSELPPSAPLHGTVWQLLALFIRMMLDRCWMVF